MQFDDHDNAAMNPIYNKGCDHDQGKKSESAPQLLCHGNYPTTNIENPEVGERNVQKPRNKEVDCR